VGYPSNYRTGDVNKKAYRRVLRLISQEVPPKDTLKVLFFSAFIFLFGKTVFSRVLHLVNMTLCHLGIRNDFSLYIQMKSSELHKWKGVANDKKVTLSIFLRWNEIKVDDKGILKWSRSWHLIKYLPTVVLLLFS
jgi:hypothetical protein